MTGLFQNGFIDIGCNGDNIPKISELPSFSPGNHENFSDQRHFEPKYTIRVTLHSLIQTYLQQ
jgi:hypothetical protein